jgi:hypothetical protein
VVSEDERRAFPSGSNRMASAGFALAELLEEL